MVNANNIYFTGKCWVLGKNGNNNPSPTLCSVSSPDPQISTAYAQSPPDLLMSKLPCLVLISLSIGVSTSPRLGENAVPSLILSDFFFFFLTNSHTPPVFSHSSLRQCPTCSLLFHKSHSPVPGTQKCVDEWMNGWMNRWMDE